MNRSTLTLEVDVAASANTTWAALVDWDQQGQWMLATKVHATEADGVGVGGGLAAFTGIGPVGFLDTMVITHWDPPRRCVVRHTGRVVRGLGIFEVHPRGEHRSLVVWSEELDLPLGALGRWGFRLVRPAFRAGVQYSLRRFARAAAAR